MTKPLTKSEKEFHRSRRSLLSKKMGKDSIAVIFSSTEKIKSFDEDYRFKQNSNFFYLTGFNEPLSFLVIAPGGFKIKDKEKSHTQKEALFTRELNKLMETWDGKMLGFENVKKNLGIEAGYSNKKLNEVISLSNICRYKRLYLNFSEILNANVSFRNFISPLLASLNRISAEVEIVDSDFLIGSIRIIKNNFEIKNIQKAVDITVESFKKAYKKINPGVYEYEVQAELEYNYIKYGATDLAYLPIVASGNNACTLHYKTNREQLKKDALLLIDSGCQFNGYSADITRTIPVNGKYTKEQREIYEIVLKANKACIKAAKPGVKFSDLKKLSEKILEEGLKKLKILKRSRKVHDYSLHGLGHHLGLDTHDAVSYGFGFNELKKGYVLTIEPGLYFTDGDDSVPKKYRGIGVRIEDDILITAKGSKNLSTKMPKEIEEVEDLMNS